MNLISEENRIAWLRWRKKKRESGLKPRVCVKNGQIRTDDPKECDEDVTVLFFGWLDGHITDEMFECLIHEYVEPIPQVS